MRQLMLVAKTAAKNRKREVKVRVAGTPRWPASSSGPSAGYSDHRPRLFVIVGLGAFTYFYARYARVIDEKLRAGPVRQLRQDLRRARIGRGGRRHHARPRSPPQLRRSGYTESRGNPMGYYQLQSEFHRNLSRPDSYFDQEPG